MILKRIFDLVGAGLVGLVTLPLTLATAITVRAMLGTPVLFRQTRPGFGGELFELVKFRTMTDSLDADGTLPPDGDRLTSTGRTLRRWSLDELPELWNVVKGEMSLVGPRPLLPEYLDLYTEEQARRHEVSPGMTGLAQVRGRNDTTWEERLRLDVWYVDNRSIWVDLKILGLTVGRVIGGMGVHAEGQATMTRFEGTDDG